MELTAAGKAAALWIALTLILLLVLSAQASRLRAKHKILLGDGGVPELARGLRAFGNAAEYAPAGMAALAAMAALGAPAAAAHITGLLLFFGRVVHALGLSTMAGASLARSGGMVMTWLAYLFAAATLVLYAI